MQIFVIGALLIIFGLLAIYSVSIHESFTLTLKLISLGKWTGEPSNYFYFFRQLKALVISLIIAIITYYGFSLKWLKDKKRVLLLFGLIFIFQLLVFVPGIGLTLQGARGWINIPGLPSIQPAEFFKLGYVFFLSYWLISKKNYLQQKEFIIPYLIVNFFLLVVFLLIPDLGTMLVLGLVGLVMFRYAGAKFKYVLFLFFSAIGLGIGGALIVGSISPRFQYLKKRFTYFFNPNVDPTSRKVGWQNQQALIAIGAGGFLGQGYGKGLQKFGFIPEAQSDFIFSAFSEEIGFIGNMFLLGLFFWLMSFVLKNLTRVKDQHLRLVGVGIISLIIIQMFVNIGVNLKILPNTGLTLPFISAGGSALMVNLIELVVLYKIIYEGNKKFR